MKKTQLNAISRSYTRKAQKAALASLEAAGINYESFCKMFSYKGSPVRLVTSIEKREKSALDKLEAFKKC